MAGDRVVRTAQVGSFVCLGVACWDQAAGGQVAVAMDGVWMLTASGAIGNGTKVVCGAAGVAVQAGATPDARALVGRAIADITTATQGPVKLSP
jgi:predicted RecA/RadA family phage recombinase